MNKLTILLTALMFGCATQIHGIPYYDRVSSVQVGDTYDQLISKMGLYPNRVNCLETRLGERCTLIYTVYDSYVRFSLDSNEVVYSIYR